MCQPILTIALTRRGRVDCSVAANRSEDEAFSELLFPSHHEPYIVVWVRAGVFYREPIGVIQGPHPLAQIAPGCCSVVHPNALEKQGSLTEECRGFLLGAVQNAVMATGFRMCLVWAPTRCAFVGLDGSVRESSEPPCGIRLPRGIVFDERTPLDQHRGEA